MHQFIPLKRLFFLALNHILIIMIKMWFKAVNAGLKDGAKAFKEIVDYNTLDSWRGVPAHAKMNWKLRAYALVIEMSLVLIFSVSQFVRQNPTTKWDKGLHAL